jgi:hypothetical protein
MQAAAPLDVSRSELDRYIGRICDRWLLEAAYVCPFSASDASDSGAVGTAWSSLYPGATPQLMVVLVSESFDLIPWLERVHVAASLWDADATGVRPEIHCYTAAEVARKRVSLPLVRAAVDDGIDLLAA